MIKTSPLQNRFLSLIQFVASFSISLAINPKTAHAARLSSDLPGIMNHKVLVAVIDTGADITHPALKGHLWRNPGELGYDSQGKDKSNNGIDDDHNGFVDDVNGWNFSDNNENLNDDQGHGTHISGIIASANPAQVMVLKAFDAHKSGSQVLSATVRAIQYAVKMQAQIINYSGGGSQQSPEEIAALKSAERSGILVVAAAGNERSNADQFGFYPAAYKLPNILSVAAVDQAGLLLPSSNYGSQSVKLAALGQQVISILPQNQYGAMTGTSQATALVTKTAALLYSSSGRRTPAAMIQQLVATGDHVNGLEGKLHNPVVLNTLRALQSNLNN